VRSRGSPFESGHGFKEVPVMKRYELNFVVSEVGIETPIGQGPARAIALHYEGTDRMSVLRDLPVEVDRALAGRLYETIKVTLEIPD
jgi:hypothetical protein